MSDRRSSMNGRIKLSHAEKSAKVQADLAYMATFKYRVTKQIGRGGYGVVYRASSIDQSCKQQYAIKINFYTVSRELIFSQIGFLVLVKHRDNLPKMVNLFQHHDTTHIVLQYFNFKPYITYFNTFTIQDVKHYIFELLIGLKNLKELGIFHRDIKPNNFLYNPDTKRGMIIDFGLAEVDPKFMTALEQKYIKMKQQKKDMSEIDQLIKIYRKLTDCLKIIGRNKIGTEAYMPLETILNYPQQSYQSDIWPVGVILLQFVVRKFNIFNNVRMINKPNQIRNSFYVNYILELASFFGPKEVTEQCSALGFDVKLPTDLECHQLKNIALIQGYDKDVDDFLHKLLTINPSKRMTVEDAMQHKFFDGIKNEHLRKLKFPQ